MLETAAAVSLVTPIRQSISQKPPKPHNQKIFYQIVGGKRTICSQRANTHTSALVAVYVFNEHILRGRLDADALVAIRDFDVVQVTIVGTDQIYPVRAAFIRASYRNMIRLHVRHIVKHQVERWRIDEDDVVNRNRGARDEAEEACVLPRGCQARNVALAVDGA
jgi:hypothetical protein